MYWEGYGPFAIGEFTNIQFANQVTYKFEIKKKRYNVRPIVTPGSGLQYIDPIISCLCGSNPIVISTLNDSVFGVKGSEAELNLINVEGSLPLSTFYSEEEDTFKLVVTATYLDSGNVSQTKTIFSGYLVQEDCLEELIDITHNIKLVFTDNLGTLKNIRFDDAAKISATSASNLRFNNASIEVVEESASSSAYIQLNNFISVGNPLVNDYIVLNDSPVGDCVYTIVKVETLGLVKRLYVRERVIPFSNTTVDIYYISGNNPYSRIKLREVIRICLHATNLLLDFKFGNQSYAQTETQSIPYPLDIEIDGRTFLSSQDNWKSCYDILQEICIAFSASLFQSDNIWYMVRWNELRYQNNQIIFTNYNNYISNQFTTVQYTPNTLPAFETNLQESIIRPNNYYKHTFNYVEQNQLLYNANFDLLGAKSPAPIATEIIDGINCSVNEYDAPGFNNLVPGLSATFQAKIRVCKRFDSPQDEIMRYLVIRHTGGTGGLWRPYKSDNIEVNKGDRLKISFAWKNNSDTGRATEEQLIHIRYTNSTNDYYYIGNARLTNTEQQRFFPALSGNLILQAAITHTQWSDYEIETEVLPTTGVCQIFFNLNVFNSNNETHYKNLKVEVINQVSANSKLNGHEHKGYINKVVKNNENVNISIDSTLKNSIYGTLFSTQFTNLVQNRIATFRDGVSLWEGLLGELITKQMMDWKYIQRIKLEGKILGIYKSSYQWLTLHQALIFSLKSGKYFIFGKAVYNLREDYIEATLYEMWMDSEAIGNQGVETNGLLDYDFKFLY